VPAVTETVTRSVTYIESVWWAHQPSHVLGSRLRGPGVRVRRTDDDAEEGAAATVPADAWCAERAR